MGRKQVVNYGTSVAVTATDVQNAVAALQAQQIMNHYLAMDTFFDLKLIERLEAQMDFSSERPSWIRELEKEWGIQ